MASKATLARFDELVEVSTNDEVIEFTLRLFEELAERSENAASAVWFSEHDRDTVNETFTFVCAASEVFPMLSSHDRIKKASRQNSKARGWMDQIVAKRGTDEPDDTRPAVVSAGVASRRNEEKAEAAKAKAAVKLVASVDFSSDAVLAALATAAEGGPVRARDVAVALAAEVADTTTAGRQQVINRVGQVLRQLAKSGEIVQLRPEDTNDGRQTCRYALPESADA